MQKSENLNELFEALSKAQGEIEIAAKDSFNPHYRSKYADLAAVWSACRPALVKNGLSVIQTVDEEDGYYAVTTILGHSSGQWILSKLKLLLSKDDMQGLGSAITYARRYSLAAMVGVSPDEDDDGNAAAAAAPKAAPKAKAPKKLSPEQVVYVLSTIGGDEELLATVLEKLQCPLNEALEDKLAPMLDFIGKYKKAKKAA